MPDGHVVLFSTKTDWAQILNPTGAVVWEFCDGSLSTGEIVDEVCAVLTLPKNEDQRRHIDELIKELLAAGLLYSN